MTNKFTDFQKAREEVSSNEREFRSSDTPELKKHILLLYYPQNVKCLKNWQSLPLSVCQIHSFFQA
ncbi:TPA: hypothetical protein ACGOVQ_001182 [Streptococcus suis]